MAKAKVVKKVMKKVKEVEAIASPALPPVELTDLEKFFVKSKFEAGETIAKINETLKKDEQLIKDYVDSFKRKGPTQFEQTICRKTQSGKSDSGITVGTKASADVGDEVAKQAKGVKNKMKYDSCITTVKEK